MFDQLKNGFDSTWKLFIRPPRTTYLLNDLGPKFFTIKDYEIRRTDFTLPNVRNQLLHCSYYEISPPMSIVQRPTIIYLHCNGGCRLEPLPLIPALLEKGLNVFTFDFAGCGNSDGEYISLGVHETNDVETIIKFLRQKIGVQCIALWGRSMGAVTALRYASKDSELACIVIDSPFKSLKSLGLELGSRRFGLPKWVLKGMLKVVEQTIQEKAFFNFSHLKMVEYASKSKCPALFISSYGDEMVPYFHVEKLFKNYSGPKKLSLAEGGHSDERSKTLINEILLFFLKNCSNLLVLKIEEKEKIEKTRTKGKIFDFPPKNSITLSQHSKPPNIKIKGKIFDLDIKHNDTNELESPHQSIFLSQKRIATPPAKLNAAYFLKNKLQNTLHNNNPYSKITIPRPAIYSERKIESNTLKSLDENENLAKPFDLVKSDYKAKAYFSHKEF